MKQIAIITGASSGLGAEFARQIAANESLDEIWLVARRADRLAELGIKNSVIIAADLAEPGGYQLIAERLKAEPVTIAICVNNAGFGHYGPFATTDLDRQLAMIDLNIRTLTALSHLALRSMDKGSQLINVGSVAGFFAMGNFAVYAATKAYVLSFSQALSAEVADRGIVVCALCPGSTVTEFREVASATGLTTSLASGKSAAKVVRHCLRVARRGRSMALYGLDWKLTPWIARFVGRRFFARLMYRHMVRPTTDQS